MNAKKNHSWEAVAEMMETRRGGDIYVFFTEDTPPNYITRLMERASVTGAAIILIPMGRKDMLKEKPLYKKAMRGCCQKSASPRLSTLTLSKERMVYAIYDYRSDRLMTAGK